VFGNVSRAGGTVVVAVREFSIRAARVVAHVTILSHTLDMSQANPPDVKCGIVFVDKRPPLEHWARSAAELDYSSYWEIPGPEPGIDGPDTDDIEEAIRWGREKADFVLVRLGPDEESYYSAGERQVTRFVDGSGKVYPQWPPAGWPASD
jgi:hypothetical protein